jgi:hypothetical protein
MKENKKKERGLDTVRWQTTELKIKGKMKELHDINLKKERSEEGRKYRPYIGVKSDNDC